MGMEFTEASVRSAEVSKGIWGLSFEPMWGCFEVFSLSNCLHINKSNHYLIHLLACQSASICGSSYLNEWQTHLQWVGQKAKKWQRCWFSPPGPFSQRLISLGKEGKENTLPRWYLNLGPFGIQSNASECLPVPRACGYATELVPSPCCKQSLLLSGNFCCVIVVSCSHEVIPMLRARNASGRSGGKEAMM